MSLLDGVLGASRAQVVIASNVTPRVVVPLYGPDAGATDLAPGPADFLFRILKPSVRVQTSLGEFAFAPWGDPDPVVGGVSMAVAAALATAAAGFALYGVLCAFKGKAL